MKTLYFIRHAESEANRRRILGSRLPFPLTEEGIVDSKRIASELKDSAEIDCIICSPIKRAVQTAESFSSVFGLDILFDERLAEQELGIFSGMDYDEVKLHPGYETDISRRWNWVPEGGGESYSMIAGRVTGFLNDLEGSMIPRESENILIVTHAVTLRLITAALKNSLPGYPEDFPNNGEILKVRFSGLGRVHDIESVFLGNSRSFNHNP